MRDNAPAPDGRRAALYDTNPIYHAWRNVHAIAAHRSLNPFTSATERGKDLLGEH